MKFHASMVEKLIQTCINQGGYSEESRLLKSFGDMRLSAYALQNQPGIVLVDAERMIMERIQRNQPTQDVIPMKFHGNVIKKLLELYKSFSGHASENKLKQAFANLDLTPYQTITTGESILVLTSDYFEKLQQG